MERDERAVHRWIGRTGKFLTAVVLLALLTVVEGCGQRRGGYGGGYGGGGGENSFWGGLPYTWGFQRPGFGEVLLSLIFGAAVGAFVSPRMGKLRKWLFLTVIALCLLDALFLPSPLCDVGWWVIGFVTALVLLQKLIEGRGGRQPKDTTFGSAEWATFDHLRDNKLIGQEGFLLGWFDTDKGRQPIHYTGDRHLLTVAPTRAGKGVSAIIPNLLSYKGSALVIDPKGENAMVTARQRRALGQTVHIVDPWGVVPDATAARFNPMDWLRADDPDVGENALMLADSMIVPSGGENAFWDEEAKSLLWGMILFVALDPLYAQTRTLGAVRDLLSEKPENVEAVLQAMLLHGNRIVSSTAARTMAKDPKMRANVFTNAQSHTHFLDSPRIRDSLSRSDFRFEDLKGTTATVYLVLPADRLNAYGRWLRMLIQQAITCNARNLTVTPAGGRPILFLLDEMAALGRLTMVEQAYGLMAGFGMQLWGIVQDLGQLDRIYDKGWETFIGNSGVLQYFGSRDEKTASYFSKLCGVSTIQKFSFSRTISRTLDALGMPGGKQFSEGSTQDSVARTLAMPDELMVLRKNQSLVLVENFNPIKAGKITWYDDDRFRQLGDNLRNRPAPPPPAVQSAVKPTVARAAPAVPASAAPATTRAV